MKRLSVWAAGLTVFAAGIGTAAAEVPNTHRLLPSNFTVYAIDGGGVVNHPVPGAQPVILPTRNLYRGHSGGYVACYSHDAAHGAYGVGGNIYVAGQIRLRGHYDGRIFQPRGYEGKDISAASHFKQLCGTAFPVCKSGQCWAGGDTGGWFGIP